jgi:hypothetical protein
LKDNPFADPSFTDRVAQDRNAAVSQTVDKAINEPVKADDQTTQQHLQDNYVNPEALRDHLLSGDHKQQDLSVSHALNQKLHEQLHGVDYDPTFKRDSTQTESAMCDHACGPNGGSATGPCTHGCAE